jgi:hypothetical protein
LRDLARHNAWATAQVMACFQGLDERALLATVPGTFGTIIETLRHLIDAEASYHFRLSGARPAYPEPRTEAAGLAVLVERAALLATSWLHFLAGKVESDLLGEARGDKDAIYAVPAAALPAGPSLVSITSTVQWPMSPVPGEARVGEKERRADLRR